MSRLFFRVQPKLGNCIAKLKINVQPLMPQCTIILFLVNQDILSSSSQPVRENLWKPFLMYDIEMGNQWPRADALKKSNKTNFVYQFHLSILLFLMYLSPWVWVSGSTWNGFFLFNLVSLPTRHLCHPHMHPVSIHHLNVSSISHIIIFNRSSFSLFRFVPQQSWIRH